MMDPSRSAQPLFRTVTAEEARALSPWPDRLAGRSQWVKPQRDLDVILEEYDRGWYAEILARWRQYVATHGIDGRLPIESVAEYQRRIFRITQEGIVKNAVVYGSGDPTQYLVSAGDHLFAFDFLAASELHYDLVARQVSRVLTECGAKALVELGCGDGMNIVRCVADGAAAEAYGGEVCANARTLLAEVAAAVGRPIHPFAFDYRDTSTIAKLPLAKRDWVLATVHSVEQLEAGARSVVEAVLALPHPPTRVVHLEPTLLPEASDDPDLVRACRKYAQINRYNTDLFSVLREQEQAGRLEILEARPRIFGLSAYNPTTLLVWRPR